uniref:EamA domain-containing protein n=1 Tax=Yersinia enterocolitica W22703 TaxID=913028 RepID=F4N2A2_YEREN|nr:hypothetical protein YEW_EM19000 [Yersinia enterocolitica W22703]
MCSGCLGQLWCCPEGAIKAYGIATNPIIVVHFMCNRIIPISKAAVIFQLNGWQFACLLFCGVNTLVGYGALAEAMARWQAAQVSALVTLTPLFTLFFSILLALAWPDMFAAPSLNFVGYVGAFVVVAGAMFSAIGHRWWPRRTEINRVAAQK